MGTNVYCGALLAHLSAQSSSLAKPECKLLTRIAPALCLLLGLHLSGYPENSYEWASWSRQLAEIGLFVFPAGAEYWRFWSAIGAQLMTAAVLLCPSLQKILSHPALIWLGGLSFPLYLIHGPLMRSFLVWMVFGFQKPVTYCSKDSDDNTETSWVQVPFPENWVWYATIPVFFFVLLLTAHLWTLTVEPYCAWMTGRMEETVYGQPQPEERVLQWKSMVC